MVQFSFIPSLGERGVGVVIKLVHQLMQSRVLDMSWLWVTRHCPPLSLSDHHIFNELFQMIMISRGGGNSHMKQTGMLVGNFEFNP